MTLTGKLPEDVRDKYIQRLKEFFTKEEITPEDIEKGCKLDFKVKLDNETHEEAVVKHLVTREDFVIFIQRYASRNVKLTHQDGANILFLA